jgi:hypothetical protein
VARGRHRPHSRQRGSAGAGRSAQRFASDARVHSNLARRPSGRAKTRTGRHHAGLQPTIPAPCAGRPRRSGACFGDRRAVRSARRGAPMVSRSGPRAARRRGDSSRDQWAAPRLDRDCRRPLRRHRRSLVAGARSGRRRGRAGARGHHRDRRVLARIAPPARLSRVSRQGISARVRRRRDRRNSSRFARGSIASPKRSPASAPPIGN